VGAGLLGTDAFQEVDLVGVTQPISKWSYQIRRAEDVAWAVARAFYIARSGRPGPVVLDFAKNAQVDMTDYEPVNVDFIRSYDPDPETDSTAVAEAVALINAAKRPLVLVGQGVELGNAQKELLNFVEKADIPCGCTLLGLSALPSNHRLNKGMLGMHGNLGPNVKTNECDVLIAVGMRFDDRVYPAYLYSSDDCLAKPTNPARYIHTGCLPFLQNFATLSEHYPILLPGQPAPTDVWLH
jgi:acetolactate synthase-1/2/3 large subunit